ncbi:MAG: hypothetical protein ACI86H_002078 [bacterium]|jgi:hypothetical protein
MKTTTVKMSSPLKTPEEIHHFATNPTQGDILMYAEKTAYQTADWKMWFDQYFKDHEKARELFTKKEQEQDDSDLIKNLSSGFLQQFPHLSNTVQKQIQNNHNQRTSINPVIGDIWMVKEHAGFFRNKSVLIVQINEAQGYVVGLTITDQMDELWYAAENDIVLHPEVWSLQDHAFVSLWNSLTITNTELKQKVGSINKDAVKDILHLFEEYQLLGQIAEAPTNELLCLGEEIVSNIESRAKYQKLERHFSEQLQTLLMPLQPLLECIEKTTSQKQTLYSEPFINWLTSFSKNHSQNPYAHLENKKLQEIHKKVSQKAKDQDVAFAHTHQKENNQFLWEFSPLIQEIQQNLQVFLNVPSSTVHLEVGGIETLIIKKVIVHGISPEGENTLLFEQEYESNEQDFVSCNIPLTSLHSIGKIMVTVECNQDGKYIKVPYPDIRLF